MSLVLSGDLLKLSGVQQFNPTPGGFGDTQTGGSIGGISITPSGASGCINIGGVPICGSIPFGGESAPPAAPLPSGSGTSFSDDCPEGFVKVFNQCVRLQNALPGGAPLTVPVTEGAVDAGDVRVPTTTFVRPILPVSLPRPRGFRKNKTGFWRRDPLQGGDVVWIPKGTVWVKSRRRNALNPRALSRAIGRVESAKSASKSLSRITVRKKAGCGCK